jgi:RNA polymerase sigma-70 factor (ECF subfamily)
MDQGSAIQLTLEDERKLIDESRHNFEAFSTLYRYYFQSIYAYVYRRTLDKDIAEDITATVFEEALNRIKTFRWRQIRFASFLFRLAERQIAAFYRKKEIRTRYLVRGKQSDKYSDRETPEDLALRKEQTEEIQEAISQLGEKDREVIRLIYFQGISREEVAEMWGWSVNRVYVRLHRALKRLKKYLKDFEPFPNNSI